MTCNTGPLWLPIRFQRLERHTFSRATYLVIHIRHIRGESFSTQRARR
jgi:hypothetical protein